MKFYTVQYHIKYVIWYNVFVDVELKFDNDSLIQIHSKLILKYLIRNFMTRIFKYLVIHTI